MARISAAYRELEMVAIPEGIPERGIEAGTMGTIVTIYDDGRMLDVEVSREDGVTIGFVDFRVADDHSLSLIAFTPSISS